MLPKIPVLAKRFSTNNAFKIFLVDIFNVFVNMLFLAKCFSADSAFENFNTVMSFLNVVPKKILMPTSFSIKATFKFLGVFMISFYVPPKIPFLAKSFNANVAFKFFFFFISSSVTNFKEKFCFNV